MSAQQEIQELYVGYFGRAGDPDGVAYWVSRYNAGMSIADIAQSFSVQPEAIKLYPFLDPATGGVGVTRFLNSVYQNLFNRSPDEAGLAYWSDQLAKGRPVGGIVLDIINGAKGADAITVANKVEVASYYTQQVIAQDATWTVSDDLADAKSVLVGVTSSSATVTAALDKVDAVVAADVAPPAPATYTLSVSAPTVAEGDAGTTAMSYVLTLDRVPSEAVTVNYQTLTNGTATAGIDFAAASGSVVFNAGVRAATVTVSAIGDTAFEANETVPVQFSGTQLASAVTATGTISNDDATSLYTLTANAPSVGEGNSGAQTLTFELTLDKVPSEALTVNYQTLSTGTATAGTDFAVSAGSVTFAAGQTKASVSITVVGDTVLEANETVQVQFTGSKLAAPVTATGTITNDETDPGYTLTASAPSVIEGNSGVKALAFDVTLDKAPTEAITVTYETQNTGTATAGSDFAITSGTITFAAGQTKASVSVNVVGDTTYEADETVKLVFSGSKLAGAVTATGTITNDDQAPTALVLTAPASVAEGDTITVSLAGGAPNTVYQYALGGTNITSGDIVGGLSARTFITNADGVAQFTVEAAKDRLTEGENAESLNITVTGNGSAVTTTVAIFDTSKDSVAPAPSAEMISVLEGQTVTGRLDATDIDGDAMTFALVNPIAGLTLNKDGSYTYAYPSKAADIAPGETETLTTTYKVTDSEGKYAIGDISIDVTGKPLTYTLSAASPGYVVEGSKLTYTLQASEPTLADDTDVLFTIAGAGGRDLGKDFEHTSVVTKIVGGKATFAIEALKDFDREEAEAYVVTATVAENDYSEAVTKTVSGLVLDDASNVPTMTISSSKSVIAEGETVFFTLSTSQLAAGMTYDYTIAGVSAEDVKGGNLNGTVQIGLDGKAVVGVTLNADHTTEAGDETLTLTVAGTTSAPVTVKDTSKTPIQGFTLSESATAIGEGQTVTFTLQTENVAQGASYAYEINGIDAADVAGGQLTGAAVVGDDGKALIEVTLLADAKAEQDEEFTLTVAGRTSKKVTVTDNANFELSAAVDGKAASSVEEGQTVVFTLKTENIPVGASYDYVISGISADDVVGGQLTGRVTISNEGTAQIAVTLVNDFSVGEMYEVLTLTVAGETLPVTVEDSSALTGKVFYLTAAPDVGPAFVGTDGDDTYVAAAGTLDQGDRLDGGDGNDTLIALLDRDVAPPSLQNIETITASNVAKAMLVVVDPELGTTSEQQPSVTLDLVNADAVTRVENAGSLGDITFLNLPGPADVGINETAAAVTTLAVYDTSANTTFTFQDTAPESQSVNLIVDNVKGQAGAISSSMLIDLVQCTEIFHVASTYNGQPLNLPSGSGPEESYQSQLEYGAALAAAINNLTSSNIAKADPITGDVTVTTPPGGPAPVVVLEYEYYNGGSDPTPVQLTCTPPFVEPTTGIITIDGIETVNITSGDGKSAPNIIHLHTDGAAELNIDGSSDLILTGTVSETVTQVDAHGLSGDLTIAMSAMASTVLGGSGNDSITGAAGADSLNGGSGNDTLTSGGGDDSLEGGEGDDLLLVVEGEYRGVGPAVGDKPAGSAVYVSGGDGNDIIDFSNASFVANDSDQQPDNDTIDGGLGVDTLIAKSADLLAVDNDLKGFKQTVRDIEAITVIDGLVGEDYTTTGSTEPVFVGPTLTLSKIQSGIETVTLVERSGNFTIVYDGSVEGTLNLEAALLSGEDLALPQGEDLGFVVESAGSGINDKITIANTAKAGEDGKAVDVFNGAAIFAEGVETLVINTGDIVGEPMVQTIGAISFKTPASIVNFVGSNAVAAGVVMAGEVNASELDVEEDEFGISLTTAGPPPAPNEDTVLKVVGSKGGDAVTLGAGQADIDLGAGDDLLIVGTTKNDPTPQEVTLTGHLDGDVLEGGEGIDELRISVAIASSPDHDGAENVSGFEILGLEGSEESTQDLALFTQNSFNTVALGGGSQWMVTNAKASLDTITFIAADLQIAVDQTLTVAKFQLDRLNDNTGTAVTIEALPVNLENPDGIAQTISDLTLNYEETITIATGTAITNNEDPTTSFTSDITIEALAAGDLKTLNVTGAGLVTLGEKDDGDLVAGIDFGVISAARTVTVDASTATGGLNFNAQNTNTKNNPESKNELLSFDIKGSKGDDILIGGIGADTISGGAGDDVITDFAGGGHKAVIDGGAGDDVITVSTSSPAAESETLVVENTIAYITLTGGTGADKFQTAGDGVAVLEGKAKITITDFNIAEGDQLTDMSAGLATWTTDTAVAFLSELGISGATTADITLVKVKGTADTAFLYDGDTYALVGAPADANLSEGGQDSDIWEAGEMAIVLLGVTETDFTAFITSNP